MTELLKDETGGITVQWIVLLVISAIIGVTIVGTLTGPIKEAYQTITNRTIDIMGSGF